MNLTTVNVHLTRGPYFHEEPAVVESRVEIRTHDARLGGDSYASVGLILGSFDLTIFVNRSEETLALAQALAKASEALLSFEANLPRATVECGA